MRGVRALEALVDEEGAGGGVEARDDLHLRDLAPRQLVARVPTFGFGFRVSGLGLRSPGFGFLVSGFWFRVSGFELRVSGFGFRDSDFGIRGLGVGIRDSEFVIRVSGL